jgi:hypothetical protein
VFLALKSTAPEADAPEADTPEPKAKMARMSEAPEPWKAPVARMSEMQDAEDGIDARGMELRSV